MIEPKTGRTLNIFDVPTNESTSNILPGIKQFEIAKGRPLEFSQIRAPIPVPLGLSRIPSILFDEASSAVEDLTWQFGAEVLACNDTEVFSTSLIEESFPHSCPATPANSPVNSHHN
jgi:hypothetical protein